MPDGAASLVAHMGRVYLAALGCHRREVYDLIKPGIVSRGIEKPCRESHSARIESIRYQRLHLLQIIAGGRAVGLSDDARPDGTVTDLSRNVQGRASAFKGVEISAEILSSSHRDDHPSVQIA